jgi:hypothetical protein
MSTKAKTQAAQPAPQVTLCDSNPYTFLVELQRLIATGFRLDLEQMFTMIPGCYTASLALSDQGKSTSTNA